VSSARDRETSGRPARSGLVDLVEIDDFSVVAGLTSLVFDDRATFRVSVGRLGAPHLLFG